MAQQFKSMNDLVTYLGTLEKRIKDLETEKEELRAIAFHAESASDNAIENVVLEYLPRTNLLNHNFLQRAFAVWGHFFVANLIISIIIGIIYACLMMILFGSIFGNLIQTTQ